MNILGTWGRGKLATGSLCSFQELQALGNNVVARIELARTGVCIDGIGDLVVAALIQTAKVEPNFGDVRVDSDGSRVGV